MFSCLKPRHRSRFCKNRRYQKGDKCCGRHTSVMCYNAENKVNKTEERKHKDNEHTTNLLTKRRAESVLLQTACAFFSSTSGSNDAFVRVILDGDSQLTCVKESVFRKLGLEIIEKHNLSIIAFESKEKVRESNLVSLKLKSQYTTVDIILNAVKVPEICFDALCAPELHDSLLHGFQLADAHLPEYHPLE